MSKSKMNIAEIQYSIETASIEIYLSGCNPPHCPGCHNESLWDFRQGLPWDMWMNGLITNYQFMGDLINHIWVLGGEPLDQPENELVELLTQLRREFDKPVWLFTGREVHEIPMSILVLCDYVKSGRYDKDLTPGAVEYGVQLASSNQHVVKIMIPGDKDYGSI